MKNFTPLHASATIHTAAGVTISRPFISTGVPVSSSARTAKCAVMSCSGPTSPSPQGTANTTR